MHTGGETTLPELRARTVHSMELPREAVVGAPTSSNCKSHQGKATAMDASRQSLARLLSNCRLVQARTG